MISALLGTVGFFGGYAMKSLMAAASTVIALNSSHLPSTLLKPVSDILLEKAIEVMGKKLLMNDPSPSANKQEEPEQGRSYSSSRFGAY